MFYRWLNRPEKFSKLYFMPRFHMLHVAAIIHARAQWGWEWEGGGGVFNIARENFPAFFPGPSNAFGNCHYRHLLCIHAQGSNFPICPRIRPRKKFRIRSYLATSFKVLAYAQLYYNRHVSQKRGFIMNSTPDLRCIVCHVDDIGCTKPKQSSHTPFWVTRWSRIRSDGRRTNLFPALSRLSQSPLATVYPEWERARWFFAQMSDRFHDDVAKTKMCRSTKRTTGDCDPPQCHFYATKYRISQLCIA